MVVKKATTRPDNPVLNQQTWKPVMGYEEQYEISPLGVVRNRKTGGILAQPRGGNGLRYKFVHLYKNNKCKLRTVHRLVALHFIENPDNKPQVNHKDMDQLNNCADNLEWVTCSENHKHAFKNGRKPTKSQLGRKQPNTTSKHLNVCYDRSRGKWKACVKRDGKIVFQPRFDSEEDAVSAVEAFMSLL